MGYGTVIKAHLVRLYEDRMDIYRHMIVENDDGTNDNVLSETPLYSAIPCRISFKSLDPPYDQEEGGRPITTAIKLFCGPDADIKPGDFIEVSRGGETYSGYAGQPASYESHLEISLTHRGKA